MSRGGTVYNVICQKYNLGGKEESSGIIPGLSLHVHKMMEERILPPTPTLSHSVSPPSPACAWWSVVRLDFKLLQKCL